MSGEPDYYTGEGRPSALMPMDAVKNCDICGKPTATNYVSRDGLVQARCAHGFHIKCIEEHFQRNNFLYKDRLYYPDATPMAQCPAAGCARLLERPPVLFELIYTYGECYCCMDARIGWCVRPVCRCGKNTVLCADCLEGALLSFGGQERHDHRRFRSYRCTRCRCPVLIDHLEKIIRSMRRGPPIPTADQVELAERARTEALLPSSTNETDTGRGQTATVDNMRMIRANEVFGERLLPGGLWKRLRAEGHGVVDRPGATIFTDKVMEAGAHASYEDGSVDQYVALTLHDLDTDKDWCVWAAREDIMRDVWKAFGKIRYKTLDPRPNGLRLWMRRTSLEDLKWDDRVETLSDRTIRFGREPAA